MRGTGRNKLLFLSSNDMMKTSVFGIALWMLILFSPTLANAEVFQWTDSRGIIHLTDNLHSVPDSLRGSPSLIIRRDLDVKRTSSGISNQPENANEEPPSQPKSPEVVSPPESEQKTVAPPKVDYHPQFINIVVINTIVHQRKQPCLSPEGCQGVFRPNFDDRRFIHSSVFDGGSRQFIQPELFPSTRR